MIRVLVIFLLFLFQISFALQEEINVYSENNKFGLLSGDNKITEAKFAKLIRLQDNAWLFLQKGKYGIINNQGLIIVPAEYNQAERLLGRYAKLGKNGKYALFDSNGKQILDLKYSKIELLYGKMFLIEKDNKCGLVSFNGDVILEPLVDDIYMPKPNVIKILYQNTWYEIEHKYKTEIELPQNIKNIKANENFKVAEIANKPITSVGYGIVSIGDYFIKIFSSISPSYEQTIDELILNHGADTAGILINSSWLLKFPFVYMKNYINTVKAPNNGPLSDVKGNLKNKINN